jgi:REP element-mobilizing transposase RayT
MMPQSFLFLHYHLISSTRNRLPLISLEAQPRLFKFIGGVIRNSGGVLLAAGGMTDHVHLLAALGKVESVADAVRTIKANSSKWVHETAPDHSDFARQSGYAAFSQQFQAQTGSQRPQAPGGSSSDQILPRGVPGVRAQIRIEFDERYVCD